jgi:Putative phage serine protease XkdF
MSVGDLDQSPVTPEELDAVLAAHPEIDADVQREVVISTYYDQPYLSGYSITGRPIYIDQNVPKFVQIGDRWLYIFKYLVVHESYESAFIRLLGWKYEEAHHYALAAEKRAVEADGFTWEEYQAVVLEYVVAAENEDIEIMPADQDLTPWLTDQDAEDLILLPQIYDAMMRSISSSVFETPKSSVQVPAQEVAVKSHVEVVFKKSNKEKQIVYGEVYTPNVIDTHNEMMMAEDVEIMAHRFLATMKNDRIDIMHNNRVIQAVVVESFIARESDPDWHEGAWVLGLKVDDAEVWQDIKDGKLNGYSIETLVTKKTAIVDVTYFPHIFGLTQNADGHLHAFFIQVDGEGRITGGNTSEDEDHSHSILYATATEIYDEHAHRIVMP